MSHGQYTNTLPIGHVLMEYELVSVLGVGGFGITYLARDTLLEKHVAIKEYFPAADVARGGGMTVTVTNTQRTNEYQTGLDRFLQEARTLAGFAHPNIVRVNRYFKANGTGYMVMDYEEGETLKTYLDKHPSPSEAAIKSILLPLLDGIGKVHQTGFLHRDIKPDNLFLRADGTPVLLDFGSARHAAGVAERTMTALVTPGYAPFEQYTTKSSQGPWSDIYALGGILYFCVTGRHPPDALSRMKEDSVTDDLSKLHGRYSDDFLEGIRWALELDEKRRPQTILEWRKKIVSDHPAPAATAGMTSAAAVPAESLNTVKSTFDPTSGKQVTNAPKNVTGPSTAARGDARTGAPDTQDISKFLDQRDNIERALKAKFQRVLTVMFTDLKGSTAIAEASGDIAVRSMLKRYHDLCQISITRHGGTLVKTIGDGSLSHFEDAAAACRAACDIQRGMEEINLSKTYKTLLLARIGMHTGECILEKNDVFGDVVNTASRFESSANPGEILVSEDTYNAIPDKSEFYARYDREVTLKGKSAAFRSYIVFWDPSEIERDRHRPTDPGAPVKAPTPGWKIALYVIVPVAIILVVTLWVTSGQKIGAETRRSIDHVIPTTPPTSPSK
jgi:serine/threonine protein kinase